MNSLFACLSDLQQDNLNFIYNLPLTIQPQELFNLLCKRFDWQGHIVIDNILYDTPSGNLFIISKYGQAIISRSDIIDFSGEHPTEILYAHPDFFNPFDYLANELQLKEPSQSTILSSAIEKCKSYNSPSEAKTLTQQSCIRSSTSNLSTNLNLLKTLATGKSYKGIHISSDPDYDDINHFLIYEGHPNDANFAGELVLKQSNTSIQINDITVYANGKGIALKVLLLLFSLGATEITGESETSAESYWEQYVPLQNPSPTGYKTFTITQYDVLNSPLYIKYKEIANL